MASSRVSVLHGKGLLFLLFISFSESISITNAVTFWATYQTWAQEHGSNKNRQQTFGNDENSRLHKHGKNEGSCANPAAVTKSCPLRLNRMLNRGGASRRNVNAKDCCLDCCYRSSTDDSESAQVCELLRGGHLHSHGGSEHASNLPTPYNIPLNGWKVIFQFFLTTMNVLCWLIPLKNKQFSENKLGLSIANAFSGGVFLSLAFGHLIPECVHGFEGYNEAMPYMIVLFGYMLIFFVEKVAFDTHAFLDHHGHGHHHSHEHETQNGSSSVANGDAKEKTAASSGRSAVILLGALAVHSILEMAAMGLARSFGDTALLSLSIALHQPAESIALLVAFLKSGMPKKQIIQFLSIFSAMGPIGVALGMAVNEFAAPIVDAIMLATVAGTFVYVGATEVIPEEWEESEHKWKKFFALTTGIVSVFFITQYTMELEGH